MVKAAKASNAVDRKRALVEADGNVPTNAASIVNKTRSGKQIRLSNGNATKMAFDQNYEPQSLQTENNSPNLQQWETSSKSNRVKQVVVASSLPVQKSQPSHGASPSPSSVDNCAGTDELNVASISGCRDDDSNNGVGPNEVVSDLDSPTQSRNDTWHPPASIFVPSYLKPKERAAILKDATLCLPKHVAKTVKLSSLPVDPDGAYPENCLETEGQVPYLESNGVDICNFRYCKRQHKRPIEEMIDTKVEEDDRLLMGFLCTYCKKNALHQGCCEYVGQASVCGWCTTSSTEYPVQDDGIDDSEDGSVPGNDDEPVSSLDWRPPKHIFNPSKLSDTDQSFIRTDAIHCFPKGTEIILSSHDVDPLGLYPQNCVQTSDQVAYLQKDNKCFCNFRCCRNPEDRELPKEDDVSSVLICNHCKRNAFHQNCIMVVKGYRVCGWCTDVAGSLLYEGSVGAGAIDDGASEKIDPSDGSTVDDNTVDDEYYEQHDEQDECPSKPRKNFHFVPCYVCNENVEIANHLLLPGNKAIGSAGRGACSKLLREKRTKDLVRDHCRRRPGHLILWEVAKVEDFINIVDFKRSPDMYGTSFVLVHTFLSSKFFIPLDELTVTGKNGLTCALVTWMCFIESKGK